MCQISVALRGVQVFRQLIVLKQVEDILGND